MINIFNSAIKRVVSAFGFVLIKKSQHAPSTKLGIDKRHIDHVFDVGANEGQFAREMREIYPGATVHSFEPIARTFSKLDEWAQKQTGKVIANHVGVGSKVSKVKMFEHLDHSPSSSRLQNTDLGERLYPATVQTRTVEANFITLDDYIGNHSIAPESKWLLKIDVQGAEHDVLKGGATFLKHCDFVIVEYMVEQLYAGQPSFYELCHIFESYGFAYKGNYDQVHKDNGEVIFIDMFFSRD